MCFLLAKNQDVQEKLFKEISENIEVSKRIKMSVNNFYLLYTKEFSLLYTDSHKFVPLLKRETIICESVLTTFVAILPTHLDKIHQLRYLLNCIILFVKDPDHPDYDSIQNLSYLDMAFNESMRIYPPVALFVIRECENEFKLGDLTIPAGDNIIITPSRQF